MTEKQSVEYTENQDVKNMHSMDVYKDVLTGDLSWLRDNDYILRGYRTPLTFWESIKRFVLFVRVIHSLFHSHNETMNVWTHLLGTILFVFLLYLTYAIPVDKFTTVESVEGKVVGIDAMVKGEIQSIRNGGDGSVPRWPVTVFTLCAIRCLLGSTIFHNFLSTTRKTRAILQTLDYYGICILISGSYVPVIYYSFYNYPKYLKFHLTAVIIINILNVSVLATPTFRYLLLLPFIVDSQSIGLCEQLSSLLSHAMQSSSFRTSTC